MDTLTGKSIDEYANSMFRFEYLHDPWIDACARYLQTVFGERIRGKVVLDYAFGRGNWSLAFLRAGAKQVIAVDASESNVKRLGDYCAARGIVGIDIRLGNFSESRQGITADVLWIYGILQHFDDPNRFVAVVREAARTPEAMFLFYAYDKASLRHAITENCRTVAWYDEEAAFDRDSLVLTPKARMRARDDLTAGYLRWWSAAELQELLRRHGLYVHAQPQSFEEFQGHPLNQEFYPHHFLCSLSPDGELSAAEPRRDYAAEAHLLDALIRRLWDALPNAAERRNAGLGLMNAHFSALAASGPGAAVVEDFLYVFNLLVRRAANPDSWEPRLRALYALAQAALKNEPRAAGEYPDLADSYLVRYLLANNIRI